MNICWIFILYSDMILSVAFSVCGCTHHYKRVGEDVTLQFRAVTYDSKAPALSNSILNPNDQQLFLALYKNGIFVRSSNCSGCTFVGNASTGNLSIMLHTLQTSAAGKYKLIIDAVEHECATVYILGVPTKPVITTNKDPSVGESVTITCNSTSTTTPRNHGLNLLYTWTVDGTDNPVDYRYSFSTNKVTLTLHNVVKADARKSFTCRATESVNAGYTSDGSDAFTLIVLYGPEDLTFDPTGTYYEKEENTMFSSVTCNSVCNPPCVFTWNKIDNGTVSISNKKLSLDVLTSSEAGTYQCIATRSGKFYKTKNLTLNVIYGPRQMTFTPAETFYRKDEKSNLPNITCRSSCFLCEYSWTGPNTFSSNAAVLSLGRLNRTVAGTYSCIAKNTKSSQQTQQNNDVRIEVRYGPYNSSTKLNPKEQEYTRDEGTILPDITCFADCYPNCTYTWTKLRQGSTVTIKHDGVLSLGSLHHDDAAIYKCTATNPEKKNSPSDTIEVKVNVRYGPYNSSTKLNPKEQEYTRDEGTILPDITCFADCYPNCTYTWTKLRQGSTVTIKHDGVLSLGSLHRDDAAIYKCTATNPEKMNSPSDTKEVKVNVRYGPDAVEISALSPVYVKEGDLASNITCSSDCYPGCSYRWKNVSDNSESSSDYILSLGTVDRYKSGLYTCTARNTAAQYPQSVENTLKVIVYYTTVQSFYIEQHSDQDHVTVDEHDAQIDFKCVVISNTATTTKIMFEGAILKEGMNVTSLSFTRQDISCYDTGAYTCEGTNDYGGTANKTLFLFVRCVPRPKGQTRRNLTSEFLSSITLSFIAIAYPEPGSKGFAWQKEEIVGWVPLLSNDHLKISSSGLQSNLTVLNVSNEDYGNYRVTVTNNIGNYVQHFFLSEETSAYQTDSQCKSQNSDQTALIVGISLGLVCCVLASATTYLAISRMRTIKKEARLQSKTKKQSAYASTSFASDFVERQEYENSATGQGESFSQSQYTDLYRYANTDKDTYDVIKNE